MEHGERSKGAPVVRVASVAILVALLWTLLVGLAPNLNTRLVQMGEFAWPGYAATLRTDPVAPTCDPAEIERGLSTCSTGTPAATGDPFAAAEAEADPFAAAEAEADPFAAAEAEADPFAAAEAEADPFAAAEAASDGDPFAAAAGSDPFAAAARATGPSCEAVQALLDRCVERHEAHAEASGRLTPTVRAFRSVEGWVNALATFGWWRELLALVVILGGLVTTLHQQHIALREARTLLEHRVRQAAELVANLLLVASNLADWRVQSGSTAENDAMALPLIWALGFTILAALNLRHLLRPPELREERTTITRLLMVIPLYAWMVFVAGAWFLGAEQHPSGQAIYLHKFVQHPSIYLGIGLYIWAGMLLARTRLAELAFDLLLPWRLPPALLAWIVVVLAAVPTAYSGASGIFVLATGAVVFDRLTRAGASPRMALGATAMSGSLGVVLRPCLVVVLIAILNKQVTTDELFGHGLQVFALTSALYLVAMLLRNRDGFRLAHPREALPATLAAARRLLPYVLVGVTVVVGFDLLLATRLNEHTAPFVVPVAMLAVVLLDVGRRSDAPGRLRELLIGATQESSHHVGALLVLMACSVGFGGVIERSNAVSALVPADFGSPWLAMAFLVVVMVVVGMTMDALGAVILVSFSVATIAYDNGIVPVHFWMMVLCAFELGYLSPPVALNHLLARQAIGRAAYVEEQPIEGGFLARHEHVVVPILVMGTALLIVAFVPLFFYT